MEPTVIRLAPGTHRVESALEITPAHTRGKPLLIDGGGKAAISGGRRLTEWTPSGHRWTHRLAFELKPDRVQSDAPGLFSLK